MVNEMMIRYQVKQYIFATVFILAFLSFSGAALGKDKITRINLVTYPESASVKVGESLIIKAEFFGTKKKKGLLGSLLGSADSGKESALSTSDWKLELVTKNGGLLSKRFLFQEEKEKLKGGFAGFLSQGLGAVSSKDSVLYTAPARPGKYIVKLTHGSLTKTKTITVVAGKPTSEETVNLTTPMVEGEYAALVKHHAPFIAQETWFRPKADYISRSDYDGNHKSDDNWENLYMGSSQAFVYFAVMETSSHWFLHYNFFHPRDYSDACVVGTCHENDNEGIILTIRRDGTQFGKLELMETLAHNNIYTFSAQPRIKKKVHNIDGDVAFYKRSHPIVFIEAGGHGALGSEYKASLFDTSKMEFKQNTGVTYEYKDGTAERPKHANDRNVGYALVPIEDTWWRLGSSDGPESNDTFDNFYEYVPFGGRPLASRKYIAGSFKGRTAGKNLAKPFWGWHDNRTKKKKVLNTGQWALDPAYAVSVCYKWPKDLPVSTDYTYNPFLESRTP